MSTKDINYMLLLINYQASKALKSFYAGEYNANDLKELETLIQSIVFLLFFKTSLFSCNIFTFIDLKTKFGEPSNLMKYKIFFIYLLLHLIKYLKIPSKSESHRALNECVSLIYCEMADRCVPNDFLIFLKRIINKKVNKFLFDNSTIKILKY